MGPSKQEAWRIGLRWMLAAVYAPFGLLHLRSPQAFLPIMPPIVPWPGAVIVATGACEIAGAVGLLIPRTRKAAAIGLALYAVCVYPANVYHALAHRHAPPLPDSLWYHAPRLLFQPVFVWWALFAGGLIDWPFRRAHANPEPRTPSG